MKKHLLLSIVFVVGCKGTDYHAYSREDIMYIYEAGYNNGFISAQRQAKMYVEWSCDQVIHSYKYDSAWRIDSVLQLEKLKY